jgi:hypothetical protein
VFIFVITNALQLLLPIIEEAYLPAIWILCLPDGFDVAYREYEERFLKHSAPWRALSAAKMI